MEELVGDRGYPLVSAFLHSKSFGYAKFAPRGAAQMLPPLRNT